MLVQSVKITVDLSIFTLLLLARLSHTGEIDNDLGFSREIRACTCRWLNNQANLFESGGNSEDRELLGALFVTIYALLIVRLGRFNLRCSLRLLWLGCPPELFKKAPGCTVLSAPYTHALCREIRACGVRVDD